MQDKEAFTGRNCHSCHFGNYSSLGRFASLRQPEERCYRSRHLEVDLHHVIHHVPPSTGASDQASQELSLIFQTGDLNFAYVTSILRECTDAIKADGKEVCYSLREEWPSYTPALGEFTEEDANQANELAAAHCSNLLDNVADRFPEPDILAASLIRIVCRVILLSANCTATHRLLRYIQRSVVCSPTPNQLSA